METIDDGNMCCFCIRVMLLGQTELGSEPAEWPDAAHQGGGILAEDKPWRNGGRCVSARSRPAGSLSLYC